MLTVNDIIDAGDNDIDCGSDPLTCGSNNDDFDANIDGDKFVDVGAICRIAPSEDAGINCNEDNECTPTVDFVDAIDVGVGVGVVNLEVDDDLMPTADGVSGATCFFDSDDRSTVHPDLTGDGIIIEHVDMTIGPSDLTVDHSCSGCDDISIADSTNTIGTTSTPTWMELTTMSTALDVLCMEMGLLSDQTSAHTNIVMELSQAFSTVNSPTIQSLFSHSTIYRQCVASAALVR